MAGVWIIGASRHLDAVDEAISQPGRWFIKFTLTESVQFKHSPRAFDSGAIVRSENTDEHSICMTNETLPCPPCAPRHYSGAV